MISLEEIEDAEEIPEPRFTPSDQGSLAMTILSKMEAYQRKAIEARYLDQVTYVQLARMLNVPAQRARKIAIKSMDTLRKRFSIQRRKEWHDLQRPEEDYELRSDPYPRCVTCSDGIALHHEGECRECDFKTRQVEDERRRELIKQLDRERDERWRRIQEAERETDRKKQLILLNNILYGAWH